jgi:hypothetical protein
MDELPWSRTKAVTATVCQSSRELWRFLCGVSQIVPLKPGRSAVSAYAKYGQATSGGRSAFLGQPGETKRSSIIAMRTMGNGSTRDC